MLRNVMLISMVGALAVLLPSTSRADRPDFSVCEGLDGAAWGMCRAGVAAGCADNSGNSRACTNIEEMYTTVTGEPPPWDSPPPALCPCDFSAVAMTFNPWDQDVSNPISFTCPLDGYGGRNVEITDFDSAGSENETRILYYYEAGYLHICESRANGSLVNDQIGMSVSQQAACQADAIAYGQSLKVALGTYVDDACSALLP